MLTVKQINEVSFGKAGFSGYKPEDVDNFIDEVASSFRQLEAERDDALGRARELAAQNQELQNKLSSLSKEIEDYRKDEDGIKDALLSAQRLAKNNVQEAKDKADGIVFEAEEKARQIVEDGKIEAAKNAKEYQVQTEQKKEELEETKRQVAAFRSSLMEMYRKHLELIDHIPDFVQKKRDEETSEKAEKAPAPAEEKREEPAPAPVKPEAPAAVEEPAPLPAETKDKPASPLHERIDFTREEEMRSPGDELSDIGIDLRTDIPDSLRREKSRHFSDLEFGEDVDLGQKKRRK